MSDKIFVDSNVFVYILSDDERFREKALSILDSNPIITVQVVNENVMACIKKLKIPAVYGQASAFLKHAQGDYATLRTYVDAQIQGLELAEAFLKVR